MKLVISEKRKFEKFSNIFQHVNNINDVFNVHINENGMFMQGFDKCSVCIVELSLKPEWFNEFSIDEDDMKVFGINSKTFYKILNTKTDEQQMELTYNGDSDNINVKFTSNGKKEFQKHFKFNLIELDSEIMNIPDEESDVEFIIEHAKYSSIIDELAMFNDTLSFKINEDEIIMNASGMEGEMMANINTDDVEEFSSVEADENSYIINQSFAIKFLKYMCQFNKVSKWLTVKVSQNRPISYIYKMDNESYLRMYLAPKMDDID